MRVRSQDRDIVHTEQMLGKNQHMTREGFLLCTDVKINRIGVQDYLNREIPELEGGADGVIRVERLEADVFRPETLASFEGKPIVDEHPEGGVTPQNYKRVTVGTILNPRRGEGEDRDFTLADFLIKDAAAIAAVRAGKREVSCGYDAEYEQIAPGRARQYDIIGNHAALVRRGRCGTHCSIGDEDMTTKKTFLDRIAAAFKTQDAEGFESAMAGMRGEVGEAGALTVENIHVHAGAAPVPTAAPTVTGIKEPGKEESTGSIPTMQDRMTSLEDGFKKMSDAFEKMGAAQSDKKAKDKKSKDEGEDDPDGIGDADPDDKDDDKEEDSEPEEKSEKGEKGEKEEDDKPEALEEKAKEGDKKAKDKKTKDRATVQDSASLKDEFRETLSAAEILAPGLKLPTYDSAAPMVATTDSLCILRRRALAAAQRTTDGAAVIKLVTGKTQIRDGMPCDTVAVVFNAASALMADRNMTPDYSKPNNRRLGATKDKEAVRKPNTPAEFNQMMRDRYKQPARH